MRKEISAKDVNESLLNKYGFNKSLINDWERDHTALINFMTEFIAQAESMGLWVYVDKVNKYGTELFTVLVGEQNSNIFAMYYDTVFVLMWDCWKKCGYDARQYAGEVIVKQGSGIDPDLIHNVCEDYNAAKEYLRCTLRPYKSKDDQSLQFEILDMVLVPRVTLELDNKYCSSFAVTKKVMKNWCKDGGEDFSALIQDLVSRLNSEGNYYVGSTNKIVEIATKEMISEDDATIPYLMQTGQLVNEELRINRNDLNGLYCVSNASCLDGAIAMLSSYVMQNLGREFGDFYVLPSSIHEFLLIPCVVVDDAQGVQKIVNDINITQVGEQDLLSNSVYKYNASENSLEIAVSGQAIKGDDRVSAALTKVYLDRLDEALSSQKKVIEG